MRCLRVALKEHKNHATEYPDRGVAMQNVHRDFVLGVLSEEELGQQIHIHELHREYAACVQTLRAFDAVSRDILQVC